MQRAIEKLLKGYLLSRGWKLDKIHDLEKLLTEAAEHDPEMESYIDLGKELTLFYIRERYPDAQEKLRPPGIAAEELMERMRPLIARLKASLQ